MLEAQVCMEFSKTECKEAGGDADRIKLEDFGTYSTNTSWVHVSGGLSFRNHLPDR
jgi:hypothetical protein